MDAYSHVLPGMKEDAVEKIDIALRTAIQNYEEKGHIADVRFESFSGPFSGSTVMTADDLKRT